MREVLWVLGYSRMLIVNTSRWEGMIRNLAEPALLGGAMRLLGPDARGRSVPR